MEKDSKRKNFSPARDEFLDREAEKMRNSPTRVRSYGNDDDRERQRDKVALALEK